MTSNGGEPWSLSPNFPGMVEFYFTPELVNGRIIRNLEDAASYAREHELRPGVDQRDEVLHALERAQTKEQARAAAHLFLRWLEEFQAVD
jgi:hypothetical protein